MDAMEKEDTDNDKVAPAFTCGEVLFVLVFSALLFIVIIFIFAKIGIKPPLEPGTLPWMAK